MAMVNDLLSHRRIGHGTSGKFLRSGDMGQYYDGTYFASREQDERAKSRAAIDWRVAAAHAEMAARYEALASVFGAKRLTELPIDYL